MSVGLEILCRGFCGVWLLLALFILTCSMKSESRVRAVNSRGALIMNGLTSLVLFLLRMEVFIEKKERNMLNL